jgi:hypothetical protein
VGAGLTQDIRPRALRGGLASLAGGPLGAPIAVGALLLFAVGFVARVAPLVTGGERVLTQFPTEDAYLMLTIARNLALGLGMSVSDGTIPTNGTQPLATFLWSALFWIAGGDRQLGVLLVQIAELVVASLVPILLWRLSLRALGPDPRARATGLLAGGAWYASGLTLPFSMNCQETGLYALAVVAAVLAALGLEERPTRGRSLGLGLLLGAAFWARNDAVFLAAAACGVHAFAGGPGERRARLARSAAVGAIAAAVALPWVVYNQLYFGSPVPISGQSQSLHVDFAQHWLNLFPVLAQYALVVWPLNTLAEGTPRLVALGIVLLLPVLVLYARAWRRAPVPARRLMALVALYGLLLAGYYGLFFGSPFFYKRYLFPLSPFFALGLAAAVVRWSSRGGARSRLLAPALVGLLLAVCALLDARLYAEGEHHSHWSQVTFTREHVPPGQWVGALQSGAVGFFHDRTLNLDGKVNPEALAARRAGRMVAYVLDSPIDWIVDFPPLRSFAELPAIRHRFRVVLNAPERKLFVLRRLPPPLRHRLPSAERPAREEP